MEFECCEVSWEPRYWFWLGRFHSCPTILSSFSSSAKRTDQFPPFWRGINVFANLQGIPRNIWNPGLKVKPKTSTFSWKWQGNGSKLSDKSLPEVQVSPGIQCRFESPERNQRVHLSVCSNHFTCEQKNSRFIVSNRSNVESSQNSRSCLAGKFSEWEMTKPLRRPAKRFQMIFRSISSFFRFCISFGSLFLYLITGTGCRSSCFEQFSPTLAPDTCGAADDQPWGQWFENQLHNMGGKTWTDFRVSSKNFT